MNHIQSILKEYQFKSKSWKRTLENLLQENIFLKIRLSNLLQANHTNAMFLETAEQYQNRFIAKDEIFGFIRRDVAEFDQRLPHDNIIDENQLRELTLKRYRLQNEVNILEATFIELKTEFNDYVAKELNSV